MIHQSDMDASQRLEFCRAGGREMSGVKRYRFKGAAGEYVYSTDYDALAAQRDEGLARTNELHLLLVDCYAVVSSNNTSIWTSELKERIKSKLFLASPGCADGEKAE